MFYISELKIADIQKLISVLGLNRYEVYNRPLLVLGYTALVVLFIRTCYNVTAGEHMNKLGCQSIGHCRDSYSTMDWPSDGLIPIPINYRTEDMALY